MPRYDDIEQWIGRAQSPAYQEAYDAIAQLAAKNIRREDAVLDVAMGTGDVVLRLGGISEIVAGTDMDMRMLMHAQGILAGARVYGKKDALEITPGISLIEDDILNTRLPQKRFNHILLTFPDIYPVQRRFSQEQHRRVTQIIRSLLAPGGFVTEAAYTGYFAEIGGVEDYVAQYYPNFRWRELSYKESPLVARDASDVLNPLNGGYVVFSATYEPPKKRRH